MRQTHLTYEELTNSGSFYTPAKFVSAIFEMLRAEVQDMSDWTILDNSCGYGSFFDLFNETNEPYRIVGADIDEKAIEKAFPRNPNVQYHVRNALTDLCRSKYRIMDNEKLIIVGNPPYNDVTSKVKNEIKRGFICNIDPSILTRDMGISFLLSYEKMSPDFVCVLHPLSYLIKKANYTLLSPFLSKYKLINALVASSQDFAQTSKGTGFPIILAIYKRDERGTSYNEIMTTDYRLFDGGKFNLKFDSISNYVRKYPNKYKQYDGYSPLFWTMRDINALKRNRSFVQEFSENTIVVETEKLPYYCYVDIFKDNIEHIPFYLGNCDVMINNSEFLKIKPHFIAKSVEKHPHLSKYTAAQNLKYDKKLIDEYFMNLLGGNYVH